MERGSCRALYCGSEAARQEGERVAGVVAIERAERVRESDGVRAAESSREPQEQRKQTFEPKLADRVDGVVTTVRAPGVENSREHRLTARISATCESSARRSTHEKWREDTRAMGRERVTGSRSGDVPERFDRFEHQRTIRKRTHQHRLTAWVVVIGERDRSCKRDVGAIERAHERVGGAVRRGRSELPERTRCGGRHARLVVVEQGHQLRRVAGLVRGDGAHRLEPELRPRIVEQRKEPRAVTIDARRRSDRGLADVHVLVVEARVEQRGRTLVSEIAEGRHRGLAYRTEWVADEQSQSSDRVVGASFVGAREALGGRESEPRVAGVHVAERGVEGGRERREEHETNGLASPRGRRQPL